MCGCPSQIFGRVRLIGETIQKITEQEGSYIFCLTGAAGYGKTEVANYIAREVLKQSSFKDVLWITARQTKLIGETITSNNGDETLDWKSIRIEIAHQLDNAPIEQIPHRLRAEPFFIILDNAETSDAENIIDQLYPMLNPSKFLLTSRKKYEPSLVKNEDISGIEFELGAKEMLLYEARTRGIFALLEASDNDLLKIYDLSCGAPLALHFIVSRVENDKAITPVLLELEQADRNVEVFYKFSLDTALDRITASAKKLLYYMGKSGAGVTQNEILGTSSFSEPDLNAAKRLLRNWHLLEDTKDIKGNQRYDLHPWIRNALRGKLMESKFPPIDLDSVEKWLAWRNIK